MYTILCKKRRSEAIEPKESLLPERIDVVHALNIQDGLTSGVKLAGDPGQFLDPISCQPALKHIRRVTFSTLRLLFAAYCLSPYGAILIRDASAIRTLLSRTGLT